MFQTRYSDDSDDLSQSAYRSPLNKTPYERLIVFYMLKLQLHTQDYSMYRHRKDMIDFHILVYTCYPITTYTLRISVVHPLFLVIRKCIMVGVPIKPSIWNESAPKFEIKPT